MGTQSVTYLINVRDRASASLKKVGIQTNKTDTAFAKLGRTLTGFVGLAVIGRVVGNSIKKMAEFEQSVSNLSAITGAVGSDLDFLKRKAIQLGAATTKTSIETVEAFKLIASAKPELLSNSAALAATTKEAIALSEASGLTLPDAAKALTSSLNQFGLAADQSSRVINILAAGSKFAAAEIPDLSQSLAEFGGVADSLKISIEQSAAAVETLSTKGLKGARAGIQLRNVFLKLGASTNKKINPKIVGLSTALENLAGIENDTTALTKMFGIQNVIAAQTLIKQRKRVDELTVSMTGTNIAYEQALTNTDNLTSDVLKMGSAWEGFVLTLDSSESAITSFFRTITNKSTEFLTKFTRSMKSFEQIAREGAEKDLTAAFGKIGEGQLNSMDDLKAGLIDRLEEFRTLSAAYEKDMERLGGRKKIERAGGILQNRFNDKGKNIDRVGNKERRAELFKAQTQIKALLGDEIALQKLFARLKPQTIKGELTEEVTPDKNAATQIKTITGAAPKTFNINIENLIENFEIQTTNLSESTTEVKKQIILAMSEALADVQPITN